MHMRSLRPRRTQNQLCKNLHLSLGKCSTNDVEMEGKRDGDGGIGPCHATGILDVDLLCHVQDREPSPSNKRSLFAQLLGHLCGACRALLARQVPSLNSATKTHPPQLQT